MDLFLPQVCPAVVELNPPPFSLFLLSSSDLELFRPPSSSTSSLSVKLHLPGLLLVKLLPAGVPLK
ncbi:hypothetical protein EJB05_54304 [Eragrostis curvula]|uniref:Uncharacterized protein n=1 Tax=Eragrostis curvula TaxID=38414 RepID=A0A5J9SMT7_9POAL|nr:hypothetical protein EJB05_54304 [Eragrostis curvula]